jgi:uncharacterized protein YndB with AHSA1/START domain
VRAPYVAPRLLIGTGMKSYEARITIKAPRETIWSVLTDATLYPEWNKTVTKLEGTIAVGQKLKIWTTMDPKRAFPAKVAALEPAKRMVWSFAAPLGMFKGERTFTLEDTADGVVFHTREVFSGWMAGPITKKMPDLQPSFDAWASGLKERAEQLAKA